MLFISILSSMLIQTMGGFWTLIIGNIAAIISTVILYRIGKKTNVVAKNATNSNIENPKLSTKVDMYDIAGDLSFVSQQLAWVVGNSNVALKKLTSQSQEIARESETTASSAEEASAGVEEIASNAAVVAHASKQAFE